MASLPPKPLDSPSIQREERRHPVEDEDSHPARPMASQSRYRERQLSMNDRVYVPRTRSSCDSYVAPVYDRRREDDIRRNDYVNRERDRSRGVWERTGDRERGSRFGEPSLEHDRDHRGFTRERGHGRDRSQHSPRDRHRDSYDRRDHRPDAFYPRSSRSPARRRAISPAPPSRTKTISSPHSRSPPAKRIRLEQQSDFAGPRARSPLRNDHEPPGPRASESQYHNHFSTGRSRSQSSHEAQENSSLNTVIDSPEDRLPSCLSQSEHPGEHSYPTQQQHYPRPESHKDPAPAVLPVDTDAREMTSRTDIIRVEPERDEKACKSDMKLVDRSVSPPKHPRFRDAQRSSTVQHRRESRSPPRGPRNHPKNMAVPATSPSFPLGGLPRAPRRPYLPPLASQEPAPAVPRNEPGPVGGPELRPESKPTLPTIPTYKPRPSMTLELDTEIARLQTHRAHLASEYMQISKGTRRALHELDTATLDLRAAESRRKIADSQVEKARAGVLGIDTNPTAFVA